MTASGDKFSNSLVHKPTPPESGWTVDLDQKVARFAIDPIMRSQPDFGPSHIRSLRQLSVGQAVNLLVMTEDYQLDDLCCVDKIEPLDELPGGARITLKSLVAFDHNGFAVPDSELRISSDDLGLTPSVDLQGKPYGWANSMALFSIDAQI